MKPQRSIVIRGALPHLNKYINEERRNRFIAAKMKHEATELVERQARDTEPVDGYPVQVMFTWHVPPNRGKYPDPDNIAFGAKFVLDGLVDAGVLSNDTRLEIGELHHRFKWGADTQAVVVQLFY